MELFTKKYFNAIECFDKIEDREKGVLLEAIFKEGYELGYSSAKYQFDIEKQKFLNTAANMKSGDLEMYQRLLKGIMEYDFQSES